MKKRILLSMIIILAISLGLTGNNLPARADSGQTRDSLTKPFLKGKLADGSQADIRGSPVGITVENGLIKIIFQDGDQKIITDPLALKNDYFGQGPQEKIIRIIVKYWLKPDLKTIIKIIDKNSYQRLTFEVGGKLYRSYVVDIFSDGSLLVEIPPGLPSAVGQQEATISPKYLRVFPSAYGGESGVDPKLLTGFGSLPPGAFPRILQDTGYSLDFDYLKGEDLQATVQNLFNEFGGSTQKSWYIIEFATDLLKKYGAQFDGGEYRLTMFDNALSRPDSRRELIYALAYFQGKKIGAGFLDHSSLEYFQKQGLEFRGADGVALPAFKKSSTAYVAIYSPVKKKSRIIGIKGDEIINIPFETNGNIFSIFPLQNEMRFLISPEYYPPEDGQPRRFLEVKLDDGQKITPVQTNQLLAIYPQKINENQIIYIQYGFEKEGGGLYLLDLRDSEPKFIAPLDHALSFTFLEVSEDKKSFVLLASTKRNYLYRINFAVSESEITLFERKKIGQVSGWNPYILKTSGIDRFVIESSLNWEREAGVIDQVFILEAENLK